ncbi:uncharacterized protein LY89DRAFT_507868 [Mollisia scopiformis]|uniref:Uncharacterized protein n=1 Tax=Mollisia scopiformis TaxID=149040 RepID=A0A194XFI0_MOLSC|nr:uncharacterized protein LY89DRAFT_507868 [Mollisia scopiformis]KUJ18923.1 hypothetical protein LY89DRAFT_507868 [Mollisia scopiformis]
MHQRPVGYIFRPKLINTQRPTSSLKHGIIPNTSRHLTQRLLSLNPKSNLPPSRINRPPDLRDSTLRRRRHRNRFSTLNLSPHGPTRRHFSIQHLRHSGQDLGSLELCPDTRLANLRAEHLWRGHRSCHDEGKQHRSYDDEGPGGKHVCDVSSCVFLAEQQVRLYVPLMELISMSKKR